MLLGSRGVLAEDKTDVPRRRDQTAAGTRHGTLSVRRATTGTASGWKPSQFVSSKQKKRLREAGAEDLPDNAYSSIAQLTDEHDDVFAGKKLQVVPLSMSGGNSTRNPPSLPPQAGEAGLSSAGGVAMEALARSLSSGAVETAGSRLLKHMGHRAGKGIGVGRVRRKPDGSTVTLAAEDVATEPVRLKLDAHGLGYDHHAGKYDDVRMAGLAHARDMGRLVTGDHITAAGRSDSSALQGFTTGQRRMDRVLPASDHAGLLQDASRHDGSSTIAASSSRSRQTALLLGDWAAGTFGNSRGSARMSMGGMGSQAGYGEDENDDDHNGTSRGRDGLAGGIGGGYEIEAGPSGESDTASLARLRRLGIAPAMLLDSTEPHNNKDAAADSRRQRAGPDKFSHTSTGRAVGVDGRPPLPGFVLGGTDLPLPLPSSAVVCPPPPAWWREDPSRVASRVAAGMDETETNARKQEASDMQRVATARASAVQTAASSTTAQPSSSANVPDPRAATLWGLFDAGIIDSGTKSDGAGIAAAGDDDDLPHGLETAEARRDRLAKAQANKKAADQTDAGSKSSSSAVVVGTSMSHGKWPQVIMTTSIVPPHPTISKRLHLPIVAAVTPVSKTEIADHDDSRGSTSHALPEPHLNEASKSPLQQEADTAPADVLAAVFGASDSESEADDASEADDSVSSVAAEVDEPIHSPVTGKQMIPVETASSSLASHPPASVFQTMPTANLQQVSNPSSSPAPAQTQSVGVSPTERIAASQAHAGETQSSSADRSSLSGLTALLKESLAEPSEDSDTRHRQRRHRSRRQGRSKHRESGSGGRRHRHRSRGSHE